MQIIDEDRLSAMRLLPCEWCGRQDVPREAHHIFGKGFGGKQRLDHPLNLVALDRYCHQSHHDGHEPKTSALVAIAAIREGWAPAKAWDELYRLRREPTK
jgi:hypothetical protein